jgi:hypothetical protein
MARNAAALCALEGSPFDITSVEASRKIRTQIVIALQAMMAPGGISDE